MSIVLIRHGQTDGNRERRYLGQRWDQPLCTLGKRELLGQNYPDCQYVISSPMKRCLETAKLIYPNKRITVCSAFTELDFGSFEGKTYDELCMVPAYQAWLSSNGQTPIPCGESIDAFKHRILTAYHDINPRDAALVVHGGTIMTIMEAFAKPAGTYYDFQVACGGGFLLEADGHYLNLSAWHKKNGL